MEKKLGLGYQPESSRQLYTLLNLIDSRPAVLSDYTYKQLCSLLGKIGLGYQPESSHLNFKLTHILIDSRPAVISVYIYKKLISLLRKLGLGYQPESGGSL